MKYKEASEYIEQMKQLKITPQAEGLKELCLRLGEPQKNLRFISVMGVTGRKSVTGYLSSVLKYIGYQVGSCVLSAVFEERERIQINGRPIIKQSFCDKLEQVLEVVRQMETEGIDTPGLWEVETAIAFLYFREMNCDVVVWESSYFYWQGMTEVLPVPMANIYTTICADRMQHVSEVPAEIAGLLADLMRRSVPVISAKQVAEVDEVLRERAKVCGCSFDVVDTQQIKKVKYGMGKQRFTYREWKDLEIGISGKEEIENAVLALEVMRRLEQEGLIEQKEKQIRKAFLLAKWDGCMTLLEKKPYFISKEVMNEADAKDLLASLAQYFPGKRLLFIIGCLRTMEVEAIIRQTVEKAEHIITLTVREDADGMHAYELATQMQCYHPSVTAADSPEEAVELARLLADKESVIVAFGALECLDRVKKCMVTKRGKI